jgi:hypothetical protein
VASNSPDNDDERESGGEEGTISPEELEGRNEERAASILVYAGSDSDVTILTDGGGFRAIIDQHYDKLRSLSMRAIILMLLVVVALFLWRIGMLGQILDMVK